MPEHGRVDLPAAATRPVADPTIAADLALALRRLLADREPFTAPWRNLARRIALDVAAETDPLRVVLSPWRIAEESPGVFDATGAFVTANALDAARLLAWLAPAWRLPSVRQEWLTLAGLLHDVGWLTRRGRAVFARTGGRNGHARSPGTEFPEHGPLGAAIVGGLTDAPVDFAEWIAAHHERSDGTGLPRRSSTSRTTRPARLLALTVRLIELITASAASHSQADASDVAESVAAAWRIALARIVREAQVGELDAILFAAVHARIVAARPDLATDSPAAPLVDSQSAAEFDALRMRRDGAERVPGPHHVAFDRTARSTRFAARRTTDDHGR